MDDTAGSDGTYLINDHTYAFLPFRTTMCSDMLEEDDDDDDSCSDDETNSDNSFDEESDEDEEDGSVMRELPINDKLVLGRRDRT